MASTHWFSYRSRRKFSASGVNEQWIVRCQARGKTTADHPYVIANEWIAANIGQFLRLPIPPFALIRKRTAATVMFASYDFGLDSTPRDLRSAECYGRHPDLCAGILVFDILIGNCDRHRGNIKVDNPTRPTRLHVFDHDHALFCTEPGEGVKRLKAISERLGVTGGSVSTQHRHVFLDEINDAAKLADWITRVENIPAWFIDDICNEKGIGIKTNERAAVSGFLKDRSQRIDKLILANKHEFSRIQPTDWELFL